MFGNAIQESIKNQEFFRKGVTYIQTKIEKIKYNKIQHTGLQHYLQTKIATMKGHFLTKKRSPETTY